MSESERIGIFCTELWHWFEANKRTLPWRGIREKDTDHKAYLILVSEVMLQQTQVSRVITLYKNFIQRFPRIEDLASATNSEIIIAWKGLGYNNRALRLRDAARSIVSRGGTFPRGSDELQELPGIGHYTAGAIRNFAFDIPTACMDVNIRRILHRFFVGPERADGSWRKSDRELLPLCEKIMAEALRQKRGSSADFCAALMDFGSLVCTKNNPKWELLKPAMKKICASYGKNIVVSKKYSRPEPGRRMAGRHVPNRIFRGRIVDVLRDHPTGLTLEEIGTCAIADWSMERPRTWLLSLLLKLEKDGIVEKKGVVYRLKR